LGRLKSQVVGSVRCPESKVLEVFAFESVAGGRLWMYQRDPCHIPCSQTLFKAGNRPWARNPTKLWKSFFRTRSLSFVTAVILIVMHSSTFFAGKRPNSTMRPRIGSGSWFTSGEKNSPSLAVMWRRVEKQRRGALWRKRPSSVELGETNKQINERVKLWRERSELTL